MKTYEINSTSIRAFFSHCTSVSLIASVGQGDDKLSLYRCEETGREAIETSASSVLDYQEGFEDLKNKIAISLATKA